MKLHGYIPDQATLVAVLSACAKIPSLRQGQYVHASIWFTDWRTDVTVGTALLSMYGKCGDTHQALRTFESMPTKNIVTYNAAISSCIHVGDIDQACKLLGKMESDGFCPNRLSFLMILDARSGKMDIEEVRWLHCSIVGHGLEHDLVLATLLVNIYGKHDCFEDSWNVFSMLSVRDVVLWSSMIELFSCLVSGKDAQKLFEQMKQEGIMPDKVAYMSATDASALEENIKEGMRLHASILQLGSPIDDIQSTLLINMYGKCGEIYSALHIFDAIAEPNIITWNTLLGIHVHLGKCRDVFQTFSRLQQQGAMPNDVSFTIILSSCADFSRLKEGKMLHVQLLNNLFNVQVSVQTALIDMYGKCGSLKAAYEIFMEMEKQSVVTWTTMISAFARHGHCLKAMELFDQMEQEYVRADVITFASLLSACCYAGLLDEAYWWLDIMVQKYGLSPAEKHYECIVDLLGRTGQLEEAEALINKAPTLPTAVAWTALLGSCRNHVDVERGERAAISLLKTNPEESASFMTLSNMYFGTGRNDEGEILMQKMKNTHLSIASMPVMLE
ncbi:hypothetical protein KP509_34G009600 [Ceratopteris richardii]|nr:hypothetical protein KP509_34G009600 [Ceratopteris richardii]